MTLSNLFRCWAVANVNRNFIKLRQPDLEAFNLIFPSYRFDADGQPVVISLQGERTLFILLNTKEKVEYIPTGSPNCIHDQLEMLH